MNKTLFTLATFLTLVLVISITYRLDKQTFVPITNQESPFIIEPPPEPELEQTITTPEPEWDTYPAQRNITNLGKVLSDIESHMPAGHIYRDSDKITWAHETSHGIASHLRMKFQRGLRTNWNGKIWETVDLARRINGFYLLNDKVCIIDEPNTTISAAARLVPGRLHGGVYNLYMVQQARSWNSTPLYVFDEWIAYSNGTACRLDLQIRSRAETVLYMLEFNVYSICVGLASKSEDPQFKNFLMWHLERSMKLYNDSKNLGDTFKQDEYLQKMRTSQDAEAWREKTRNYLGKEWTKKVLGF
jgi:hypothetical protein